MQAARRSRSYLVRLGRPLLDVALAAGEAALELAPQVPCRGTSVGADRRPVPREEQGQGAGPTERGGARCSPERGGARCPPGRDAHRGEMHVNTIFFFKINMSL